MNHLNQLPPRVRSLLVGLLAILLIWGLQAVPWVQREEARSIDLRAKLRKALSYTVDDRLFLVGIDEATLEVAGAWPFPRGMHADWLIQSSLAEPRVIGWDIIFSEPSTREGDPDPSTAPDGASGELPLTQDGRLSRVLELLDYPVVLAGEAPDQAGLDPVEINTGLTDPLTNIVGRLESLPFHDTINLPILPFRTNSFFGFANAQIDNDGVRRKVPLVIRYGQEVYPSLSLQLLLQYLQIAPGQVRVEIGKEIVLPGSPEFRIPINERGEYLILYEAGLGDLTQLNYAGYSQVLKEIGGMYKAGGTNFLKHPMHDKLVLIGQTASGLSDLGPTPFSEQTPLVLLHFNILNNVLQRNFLRLVPLPWVLLGCGVGFGLLHYFSREKLSSAISMPWVAGLLFLSLAFLLHFYRGLLLPVAAPMFVLLVYYGLTLVVRAQAEMKARSQMQRTFSSYLSPALVKSLISDPTKLKLGGNRKRVTIMFTDLRGFTSLAEKMEVGVLVLQLNEYFTEMVSSINRQGGTLQKFIGDAIMAAWGDLIDYPGDEDVARALEATCEMSKGLKVLNARWVSEGRPELKMGLGLHRGEVIVGNIGAPQRMEFTLMGDSVNFTSRLEGVTKEFGCEVLVSDAIRSVAPPQFVFRSVALLRVMGKTKPMAVHELVGKKGEVELDDPEWLPRFEQGFQHYLGGRFEECSKAFAECARRRPTDRLCAIYLERCEKLRLEPVDESWDGVYGMSKK